jgi:hypothetical protein
MVYRSSTHVLTGATKAGKSWLAYQLMMAAEAGKPFLGLETKPVRVLLISLEMTAGMVRTRMEAIARDVGLAVPPIGETFNMVAPTMDDVPCLDIGSEHGAPYLKDLISEAGAELVVLDTLYRFLPGLDPNSNADMGPVFGQLNETAQSTGAGLLMLDHVAKGEQLGPVSHSAIGAQVKRGASRVIIGLRRTPRSGGGRWQIDVESHFGSWDEPIYYERPLLKDKTRGEGCVRCRATRALEVSLPRLERVFEQSGEQDEDGRLCFRSKRQLTEALIKARLASGKADANHQINAILRDFVPEPAAEPSSGRPIVTSKGPRKATVFTWCAQGPATKEA